MILYSILVYILPFTQGPIPACLDGTIDSIAVGFSPTVEFSTISTLESVISVSSDYLCINWYGSSLGVYTRVGVVPRLQCLGQ